MPADKPSSYEPICLASTQSSFAQISSSDRGSPKGKPEGLNQASEVKRELDTNDLSCYFKNAEW